MDPHDAALPAEFDPSTLIARLHIKVSEVSADRVVGTMPVAGNIQPYGLLHGGASAALAETLGSLGAMAHAGPDAIAMGTDLTITHHRAVTDGEVTGVATPLHRGRTVASYAIAITAADGTLVASARLTCAIRPK